MDEVEVIVSTQDEAFALLINNEIPKYMLRFGGLILSAISYDSDGQLILIYKEEIKEDE